MVPRETKRMGTPGPGDGKLRKGDNKLKAAKKYLIKSEGGKSLESGTSKGTKAKGNKKKTFFRGVSGFLALMEGKIRKHFDGELHLQEEGIIMLSRERGHAEIPRHGSSQTIKRGEEDWCLGRLFRIHRKYGQNWQQWSLPKWSLGKGLADRKQYTPVVGGRWPLVTQFKKNSLKRGP